MTKNGKQFSLNDRGGVTIPDSDRTESEIGLESETLRTGVRNRITTPDSGLGLFPSLRIGLGLTTPDSGLESEIMHNSGLRTGVWELSSGSTPDSGLESEIGSQLRTPDSSPKSQSESQFGLSPKSQSESQFGLAPEN